MCARILFASPCRAEIVAAPLGPVTSLALTDFHVYQKSFHQQALTCLEGSNDLDGSANRDLDMLKHH
jgi:hypothetical protein